MIEPPNNLSATGQLRREQILDRAIREATHRRYSRIERRLGVVLIAAIGLTGTLLVRHRPVSRERSVEIAGVSPEGAKPSGLKTAAAERIQIVRTDPHIVERLSVPPEPPRWTVINDDELLATLANSGHPAGLVEINGQTRIIFR